MPLSAGEKLGPYEILTAIGKGGMGEVYKAHDPRLQRDVAIKVSAQRFNERFEREARAVAALNHPNICHIYDVGPNYLVMELIDGPTLDDLIKESAIPLEESLRIADQIAEALYCAHEKHITHRDLKPANIKLTEDGVVKVLDFGLAKIGGTPTADSTGGDNSPTLSMTLTQAGMILGTAAYMSPEQARGKNVDARADIWAFGVVLYEMVTGKRLFKGEDLTETLASVVKDAPDLSAVPPKVRRLLEACLQKDPKQRLQSIGDRKLLLVEPERIAIPAIQEPARTKWLWPAIASVGVLAAFSLAPFVWTHFRETPVVMPTFRYQISRPKGAAFGYMDLSPDGRYLAYSERRDNRNLHIRALDSLEEREFPGTDGTTYPFFSPDSSRIAFFKGGKLKVVAVGGGPPTDIADAPDPRGGTWGADGTVIFSPTVTGPLFRVSSAGGVATAIQIGQTKPGDSQRYPAFAPGSDRFFFLNTSPDPGSTGIFTATLADPSRAVRLSGDGSNARFVAVSGTNGYLLFRRQLTLVAQPFDLSAAKFRGDAFPLAESILDLGNIGYAAFAVNPNGTLIYGSGGDAMEGQLREVVVVDRSGKTIKSLAKRPSIFYASMSPDGSTMAYSTAANTPLGLQRPGSLWLLDVAHGTSQPFTFAPVNPAAPLWSRDGRALVYSNLATISNELFIKSTSTSGKTESLGPVGTNLYPTGWSPDGKLLVYTVTGATTKDDLWLLPMDGNPAERKPRLFKQTQFAENGGQISPDGIWMVYSSDASGMPEIYIEPLAGGGQTRQISVGGGVNPTWRADGRELYFTTRGNKLMAVDIMPGPDLTFGAAHELFVATDLSTNNRSSGLQPNATGSQFLVLRNAGEAPTIPPMTVVTNWLKAYGK